MTKRENLLSILRRTGYKEVPSEFFLCPDLVEVYKEKTKSDLNYMDYFEMPWRRVSEVNPIDMSTDKFLKYYKTPLKPGTFIDIVGVAHEPGSEAARHMTYTKNPLKDIESLDELKEFPFPNFDNISNEQQILDVKNLHARGIASVGNMQMTIWETAWCMRGMENLMMDMMTDDPIAEYLLDKITDFSIKRATLNVQAGIDILFIGDDVGMQNSIMMSHELYTTWLQPRLKKLIQAVKKVNPNVIVVYHSCGLIEPFIPYFIDAGIDVLNPIQSEVMDFKQIHDQYGDKLSFHGTIGTQKMMPFGTPQQVKNEVFRNLRISGDKGGLFVAPTHLLEPEVPWENIVAYVEACKEASR